MMKNEAVENYWNNFMATLPFDVPLHNKSYVTESLGDTPALASKLSLLVAAGLKTATCSALWEWEAQGKTIPQPGIISIILDGKDQPVCIIETTEVYVCRFNAVDDEFAHAEGEGDLSLKFWREAHTRYFTRTLPMIGKEFSEEMPLVCERFRVIYR